MAYRKIETRIWNDAKFSSLSDRGKLAFLFVMTHPHMTSLGAMRATIGGLAAELRWPEKDFRKALGESSERGMVEFDEGASFLAVPKFLRYNGPESPNVVKSWEKSIDLIPECSLRIRLFARVVEFTGSLPKAFANALPEVFRKSMPNQEQEQEQEQEQVFSSEPPSATTEQPVLMFPVVGDSAVTEWPLYQSKIDQYRESYPGIDPLAECRKARQWCIDSPAKRKTAGGMTRFLNAWMERAQNSRPKASERLTDTLSANQSAVAEFLDRQANGQTLFGESFNGE